MSGMKGPFPTGGAANFRILLLLLASVFVIGILFYSNRITDELLERERKVVALYARSVEFVASDNSVQGDFSFAFEVIQAIDFPIIQTSPRNDAVYWKNIDIDTAGMSAEERQRTFARLIAEMDRTNPPIAVPLNDSTILSYVHYGESEIIQQLRWFPVSELVVGFIIIIIAYAGFNTIRRSEESSIWVGMAKETAHQLGTPLSSLMGWIERLKELTPQSTGYADTVQEMERDVVRLNKVAARFSKIGSKPDLHEENVTEVIAGVISYFAKRLPKTGKKIDLVIETPEEFRARINRELFEWVIENLMKNALDAIEGSTGRISFALARSADRLIIDVTDTGKGIESKHHNDVFRPGYSTKKRGWGLGLSLSRRIIENYHRGKLSVKSSLPGQGTTFRIRLNA